MPFNVTITPYYGKWRLGKVVAAEPELLLNVIGDGVANERIIYDAATLDSSPVNRPFNCDPNTRYQLDPAGGGFSCIRVTSGSTIYSSNSGDLHFTTNSYFGLTFRADSIDWPLRILAAASLYLGAGDWMLSYFMGHLMFRVYDYANGNVMLVDMAIPSVIAVDTWYEVVISRYENNFYIFLNGLLIGSATVARYIDNIDPSVAGHEFALASTAGMPYEFNGYMRHAVFMKNAAFVPGDGGIMVPA